MIKSLALLTAKDGMTREEFRKVWLAEHAPLVRAVPGVRKYVLSFILAEPTSANAPIQPVRVDAIAELWYDDVAAQQRAAASPEMKIVTDNGALYLGAIKPLLTEEVSII
jgi:uncharacterized protein (TIGR02118 family)